MLEAKRETLRDLVALANALEARGGVGLPLIERRFIGIVREFDDRFHAGLRPDLHRMLGLPRGRGQRPSRPYLLEARDVLIQELAATLPAELKPRTRARKVCAMLNGPDAPTVGLAALLIRQWASDMPRSARQFARIIQSGQKVNTD